ncbi:MULTISPECIES: calcium:proton antiporter [Methylobacterium]|uniref:Sodium-potassium/proton antiporter ChaA n=1 Tax=Methylobacterium jeotgali TaxID=381630 RepID=A0ABQ4SUP2_9HYPH|nr:MULTISPECIES: calcium:proton antiporter [Methylobacterium]PIU04292.1 MAG: calcium:proton antiporter [Methylobacterium sp. CG09_land_8_20_14_0_10_71_15]PIU11556.1 MAG: calcium:proton antiporter [Methylobacterium sp. CG08_land_8_20_14_0_20_71_15]GBU16631.1 calcium/sodium:proton antiporter [Methylobacterium sp.]GJE05573.1 Sodium-potassium/proton antiporter ChaA [Methylobacterium jeotgali]
MGGILRLVVAWATVGAFTVYGKDWLGGLADPMWASLLFAWLLGVILWAAFGVVHEAEELAHMLGEPLGTLILTLAIVIIEVVLVSAVMLSAKDAPTLGRDTMFAVLMIVLNGVVGLGLLIGGLRHHQQSYNLQGASAFLSVIIPLTVIALVLPNFTTSTQGGTFTTLQAIAFSAFTVALYGVFLLIQTGRHRDFFMDAGEKARAVEAAAAAEGGKPPVPKAAILRHTVLLVANILPIVLLSKSLATILDHGIAALKAPTALGGVVIAMIVFTPEAISSLKAVARNELQRAINLCLGAATSTVGLTVPAVLAVGLLTGQTVVLGLAPTEMALLVMTLILSTLTFSGLRTTVLEGAVHLILFFVYLVLIFSP